MCCCAVASGALRCSQTMLQRTCWLTQRLTKSMASRSSICQTSSSSSCQQTPQALCRLLIRASLRAPRRTIASNLCSGSMLKLRSLRPLASRSKSCTPTSTRRCARSRQYGRRACCLRPVTTAGTTQASWGGLAGSTHWHTCSSSTLNTQGRRAGIASGTISSAACHRLCS
jgi:hypothetical protein